MKRSAKARTFVTMQVLLSCVIVRRRNRPPRRAHARAQGHHVEGVQRDAPLRPGVLRGIVTDVVSRTPPILRAPHHNHRKNRVPASIRFKRSVDNWCRNIMFFRQVADAPIQQPQVSTAGRICSLFHVKLAKKFQTKSNQLFQ
jgi:hypothetical protein